MSIKKGVKVWTEQSGSAQRWAVLIWAFITTVTIKENKEGDPLTHD